MYGVLPPYGIRNRVLASYVKPHQQTDVVLCISNEMFQCAFISVTGLHRTHPLQHFIGKSYFDDFFMNAQIVCSSCVPHLFFYLYHVQLVYLIMGFYSAFFMPSKFVFLSNKKSQQTHTQIHNPNKRWKTNSIWCKPNCASKIIRSHQKSSSTEIHLKWNVFAQRPTKKKSHRTDVSKTEIQHGTNLRLVVIFLSHFESQTALFSAKMKKQIKTISIYKVLVSMVCNFFHSVR